MIAKRLKLGLGLHRTPPEPPPPAALADASAVAMMVPAGPFGGDHPAPPEFAPCYACNRSCPKAPAGQPSLCAKCPGCGAARCARSAALSERCAGCP